MNKEYHLDYLISKGDHRDTLAFEEKAVDVIYEKGYI